VDAGRAEVYAAELAAFDGTDLEQVRPFDGVAAAIERVIAGGWWPGPAVGVVAARSDAGSSCARQLADGRVQIRVAAPQATWATAAHELAHALAGVAAGHDPSYRRAHLDVIADLTNRLPGGRRGTVHVDQLANAYAAAELEVGARAWARPPTADPFAL